MQQQKEDKIHINVRIPQSMADWINSMYSTVSQAVNESLELLKESKSEERSTNEYTVLHDIVQENISPDINIVQEQQKRIEDLKAHIQDLNAQLAIKDAQIDKHSFHIQSLIQENSRLNLKLLPENTVKRKLWWQFWKI
jgi:Arc/MetJ-type ribon-helix-helix transcriptional regulator